MGVLSKNGFFSADLLKEIRSRFAYVDSDPFSGQRIFLEAASGSLRLKSVIKPLTEESTLPDQLERANPASKHAKEVLKRGIENVKLFLGAESGTIMPAISSTHAIFRVVNAVTSYIPGSNVVTTELDHPAVYDSTRYFAKRTSKEWRVAKFSRETGSVSPEAILEKVDNDTCLLAFIHASNITGAVLDVEAIIKEARKIKPDLYVLVDGVQYAPHDVVEVEKMGVDAYVFGPYKAFCVKGIGFAYLSDRLSKLPHWKLGGKANTDWVLGSPENATYAAWSAVVDYVCWLGSHFTHSADRRKQIVAAMERCKTHERLLLNRLLYGTDEIQGLLDMDHVTVHGIGKEISNRVCLILFSLVGMDSYQGVEYYKCQHIRVHNRVPDEYSKHILEALGVTGGIRLSAGHYNTPEEINFFLEVTDKYTQ